MSEKRTLVNTLIFEKNNNISGGIYNKLQVDFAYNSNHMEGSRLTHDQTRFIFETHSIDGNALVNDIFEASNHFKCFDYILETYDYPLTEEYIKKLHSILKNGLIVGKNSEAVVGDYKKYANYAGAVPTTKPENISNEIVKLISDFNNKEKAEFFDVALFHKDFEKIHPFYDGNGRIGRLLMFKMCLQNGIVPFIVSDFERNSYALGLREWQLENKASRFLDTLLLMQDDMKAILDYFEIEYDNIELTSTELIRTYREK